MKSFIPQKIKNIYHLFKAVAANLWFGFPSQKLIVIGITGTNGKTTTTQMITKILESAGHKVAMSSTINFKVGDDEWVNKTKFTTLDAWSTQKLIRKAVNEGCEYLVLETASHALDQHRVWGVDYDVAVITNVTREHLDYHKTMDEYRHAKLRLFEKTKKAIIVNLDMENPEDFLQFNVSEKYGYTTRTDEAIFESNVLNLKSVRAEEIRLDLNQSMFKVNGVDFFLNLVGIFNVENALAAICVGLSQNVELGVMSKALAEIKKVPGRMDSVENNLGLNIIIDYALTPDSMEKLGELVAKMREANPFEGESRKKVIWVFGSCGDRDRGKRPVMGEIVAKYSDYCIVTNEDPYTEDPQQIIDEVFSGVIGENPKFEIRNSEQITNSNDLNSKQTTKYEIRKTKVEDVNCWRIMDRKEAIKKAIDLAYKGDIILITGKGAEEVMLIGDQRIPWNDRNVVEEILQEKV